MNEALLANRFEIVHCLAAGEPASLYLAADHKDRQALSSLQVLVGLKIIDRSSLSPCQQDSFHVALRRLSTIQHPHILKPYEAFSLDNLLLVSCESFHGVCLRDLMHSVVFDFVAGAKILSMILSALEAAIAADLQPRSLNPQDIYLSAKGELKLDLLPLGSTFEGSEIAPSLAQDTARLGLAIMCGELAPAAPALRKVRNRLFSPIRRLWRRRSKSFRALEDLLRTWEIRPGIPVGKIHGELRKSAACLGPNRADYWQDIIQSHTTRDIVSQGTAFIVIMSVWCAGCLAILFALARTFSH